MSSFKITFDPQTLELRFENNALSGYCDFIAALDRHNESVDISGLRYGATILIDDAIVAESSFPPEGVKYVSTDQDILEVQRLSPFPADAECKVIAWVDMLQGQVKSEFNFTVPRPTQPFTSWTWNGTTWIPPVDYPTDGISYIWDEDQNNWLEDFN